MTATMAPDSPVTAAAASGTSATASTRPAAQTLDPQVRAWLRLEGLAAFIAGAAVFGRLGGEWIWFVPALLLVDVSMIGYLRGPRLGAMTYDLAHNWAVGLGLLGLGLALALPSVTLAGAVLVAHTGADRALGYGLKLGTGFGDTHLGTIGRATTSPRP
jgi:Domain of unknown function (DUF4260)